MCVTWQVQAVREIVPGRSNNEIVLVLKHYDDDVERAIQAFLEGMWTDRSSHKWTTYHSEAIRRDLQYHLFIGENINHVAYNVFSGDNFLDFLPPPTFGAGGIIFLGCYGGKNQLWSHNSILM